MLVDQTMMVGLGFKEQRDIRGKEDDDGGQDDKGEQGAALRKDAA